MMMIVILIIIIIIIINKMKDAAEKSRYKRSRDK